jgi:hypothetical protein
MIGIKNEGKDDGILFKFGLSSRDSSKISAREIPRHHQNKVQISDLFMHAYFQKTTSAAPLAVLRSLIGIMLFVSLLRFWYKGWINDLYIKPKYFFPFYGFEWVQPLGTYTYLLFAVCMISAIFVAIGLFYRASIVTLFVSFTYIELMDKSTY